MAATHEDRNANLSPGVAIKAPCRAATTAAITLSGEQTIDAVVCVAGDRVLVKNQTNSIDNGIYGVSTGAWAREPDFDGNRDVVTGTFVFITSGATNAGAFYECTTSGTVVFGTSHITFAVGALGPIAIPISGSNVTFTQSGTPTAGSVSAKLQQIISVKDPPFGAVGDGVTDDTAAFAAIRAYAATLTPPPEIIIPQGTYKITVSPSWPLNFLSIKGIGLPEIVCSGAGSVFDMTASSAVYGMNVENLKLRGNAAATAGMTCAKISHSTFKNLHAREILNIGFDFQWSVACVMDTLVCSINEQAMTTVPARGLRLTSSGGLNSTANILLNTIMEGPVQGIDVVGGDFNTFEGGTAEACTARGVNVEPGNKYNSFRGMGFESNTTEDILDQGTGTTVEDCYSKTLLNLVTAVMPHYKNILAQTVTIDGTTIGASMENIRISNFAAGGVFTDSAVGTYKKNIYNVNTASYFIPGVVLPSIWSTIPNTQTGATYTVLPTDTSIIANRAGTVTLTLEAASAAPGKLLMVRTIQAQTVVSASANVVPRAGGAAGTAILAAAAGNWAILQSDSMNWQIMAGS